MTSAKVPSSSAMTANALGGDLGISPPSPELVPPLTAEHRAPSGATLRFSSKIGYASGQLIELVVGSMLNIFMLFYATVVCGIPGSLAGLAVGVGLAVDALMDPLIGSLSDGWRSRWGRRVPFMVVALPLILITFNLLFALPVGWSTTALFVLLTVLSISLRISLSIFSLPYQALGSELSEDYVERSSIAAWRWAIGLIGTLGTIILGYGVFLAGPNGTLQRESYSLLALTLSTLIVVGGILSIRVAMATRSSQKEPEPNSDTILVRLFREMKEVLGNPTFRIIFAASLLFSIASGLNSALGMHVSTFFWHLTAEQMQPMALTAVAGLVLGAPLAAPLTKRIEKRTMMILGMGGAAVCTGALVVLRLLDILPLAGSALITALSLGTFVGGVFSGLTFVALLAMIPDAADEHEYLYGTRRDGLYVAGWAFANKAATGVGILAAGIVLDLIGFPTDVAKQGVNAHIPAWQVDTLAVIAGPGGSILTVVGLALMLLYRVDRRRHAQIVTELNARRATDEQEAA